MSSEEIRSELRQDFLKVLRQLENREARQVTLQSGFDCGTSKVLGIDREILHVLVDPLRTPNGEVLSTTVLRLTDVDSISFDCNLEK